MSMPAGSYWIGDLCYVLDDVWDEVCELYFASESNDVPGGEFTLADGRKFAMYGTRWGDGSYEDQSGRSFGVDSGTLGCIMINDIANATSNLGHVTSFRNNFDTGYTDRDKSVIKFGHIQIDTGDFADEEQF